MVVVSLEISATAGRTAEMIRALRSLIAQAQAAEGCMGCRLYAEPGNCESLCYTEEWATPELLESQIRSSRFTRLLSVMESASESPVLKFNFVSESRGLDYVEKVRSRSARPAPSSDGRRPPEFGGV